MTVILTYIRRLKTRTGFASSAPQLRSVPSRLKNYLISTIPKPASKAVPALAVFALQQRLAS
ncbi:MAG: hypothetical protein ACI93R_002741, partial [Flavobacteriales bacterium]